jgi:alkaline phosphatase
VTAHNAPDKVQTLARQIDDRKPKNVLMFLGEVRIAAVGPQAARVNGVIDETDIFGILSSFAGSH